MRKEEEEIQGSRKSTGPTLLSRTEMNRINNRTRWTIGSRIKKGDLKVRVHLSGIACALTATCKGSLTMNRARQFSFT